MIRLGAAALCLCLMLSGAAATRYNQVQYDDAKEVAWCNLPAPYKTTNLKFTRSPSGAELKACVDLSALPANDQVQAFDLAALRLVVADKCSGAVKSVTFGGKQYPHDVERNNIEKHTSVTIYPDASYESLYQKPVQVCIIVKAPCANKDSLYNIIEYIAEDSTCARTPVFNGAYTYDEPKQETSHKPKYGGDKPKNTGDKPKYGGDKPKSDNKPQGGKPAWCNLPAPYKTFGLRFTRSASGAEQTACVQLAALPAHGNVQAFDLHALKLVVSDKCYGAVKAVTFGSTVYAYPEVERNTQEVHTAITIYPGVKYEELYKRPVKVCITLKSPCANRDSLYNIIEYIAKDATCARTSLFI